MYLSRNRLSICIVLPARGHFPCVVCCRTKANICSSVSASEMVEALHAAVRPDYQGNEMQIFVFKSYHTLPGKHYFKVNIYIYSANLYSLKEGDIYLHRRSRMSNRLTWRHSKIVVKWSIYTPNSNCYKISYAHIFSIVGAILLLYTVNSLDCILGLKRIS